MEKCGKRFMRSDHLNKHMRTHADILMVSTDDVEESKLKARRSSNEVECSNNPGSNNSNCHNATSPPSSRLIQEMHSAAAARQFFPRQIFDSTPRKYF